MGKKKDLSDDLKPVIINLALKGYSMGKIRYMVNKSHSTVQYVMNKFRYNGTTQNIPRRSKERTLTEREERYVVNKMKTNPKLTQGIS